MENKTYMLKNNIKYLNNGRSSQNSLIHSTLIKSSNIKANNGKVFTKELNVAMQENNFTKSNSFNTKGSKLVNWFINTLNPINHMPIISTINNMTNKTNKSLDIVQSAIGGAIYGGGPIGLAKGIGGWFINKLIPKNKIANNTGVLEDKSPKNNNLKNKKKFIQNISFPNETIQLPKTSLKNNEKNSNLSNNISQKPTKIFNIHSLYYPSIEIKQKKHMIDTDA